MRTLCCWFLLTLATQAAQYQVFYYLPTGNDGRQVMIIEAPTLERPAGFSNC